MARLLLNQMADSMSSFDQSTMIPIFKNIHFNTNYRHIWQSHANLEMIIFIKNSSIIIIIYIDFIRTLIYTFNVTCL